MSSYRIAGSLRRRLAGLQQKVLGAPPGLMASAAKGQRNLAAHLNELTEALHQALPPINPPPGFREGLGRNLGNVARYRKEPQVVLQNTESLREGLLLGLGLGGALSLATLLLVLLLRGSRRRARTGLTQ
ncbi:MAG: hypothetical protein ACUVX9_10540 [Anaerolineae bacterium]